MSAFNVPVSLIDVAICLAALIGLLIWQVTR